MSDFANVDCAVGREMGCQTFCCRLLVRLDPDERAAYGNIPGNFVEKDADGYCKHLNRETQLCAMWDRRSRVCRSYDCNGDFLLQVAVRSSFRNIAELAKLAAIAYIPREDFVSVPPATD